MDQGQCPKCGASMTIAGLGVGDLVACPRCGETSAAWEAAARGAAAAFRAEDTEELPSPPPLPTAAVREGDPPPLPPSAPDHDAATTSPAANRRPERVLSARTVVRWVVLGSVVATLIIGALWIFRPRTRTSGLEHVPGDAAAFVSIRVAELWKGPLAEKTRTIFGEDIDKALQEACGLNVQDIERVTVVLPRLPGKDAKPDLWAVIKTAKPYDTTRLRAGFAKEVTEHAHNGKTYFAGPAGAIHFLADDLLIFGTPDGVKDFLSRSSVTAGPLRASVALAEKNDVVLAVRNPWAGDGSFGYEHMRWPKDAALTAAPLAVLTMNAGHKDALMDLHIDLADEAGAKSAEKVLKDAAGEPRARHLNLEVTRASQRVTLSGKEPIDRSDRDFVLQTKRFSVEKRFVHDEERPSRQWEHVLIYHGIHIGSNFLKPAEADIPNWTRLATSYYARRGPAGIVLEKFNWWPGPMNDWASDARLPASLTALAAPSLSPWEGLAAAWSEPPFAVVGIEAGTLASYARPYQPVHYFAPLPELVELSLPKDGKEPLFRFLRDAQERGAMLDVRPGEPRPLLAASKSDGFYHALFIDAYKGSIESLHEDLLTKEGMELCLKKLAPGGVLCYHISNRYYELTPLVADVAASLGCVCRAARDDAPWPEARGMGHFSSSWVMVARRKEDLEHLKAPPGYHPRDRFAAPPYWTTPERTGKHLWTDAARPFAGLYRADPIIGQFTYAAWLGNLKHYPGIPRSEPAYRMLDEPFEVLGRFILANRNEK